MCEKKFMEAAIKEAYTGVDASFGGPFGAVIVKDDEIISAAHNTVLLSGDPTKHAEMNAISAASQKIGSYDLSGCRIYSTTEPCPMCLSAIHWARLDKVIFGTNIDDVARLGFNELMVSSSMMKEVGKSPLEIQGEFMREKCIELLEYWNTLPNKVVY